MSASYTWLNEEAHKYRMFYYQEVDQSFKLPFYIQYTALSLVSPVERDAPPQPNMWKAHHIIKHMCSSQWLDTIPQSRLLYKDLPSSWRKVIRQAYIGYVTYMHDTYGMDKESAIQFFRDLSTEKKCKEIDVHLQFYCSYSAITESQQYSLFA